MRSCRPFVFASDIEQRIEDRHRFFTERARQPHYPMNMAQPAEPPKMESRIIAVGAAGMILGPDGRPLGALDGQA